MHTKAEMEEPHGYQLLVSSTRSSKKQQQQMGRVPPQRHQLLSFYSGTWGIPPFQNPAQFEQNSKNIFCLQNANGLHNHLEEQIGIHREKLHVHSNVHRRTLLACPAAIPDLSETRAFFCLKVHRRIRECSTTPTSDTHKCPQKTANHKENCWKVMGSCVCCVLPQKEPRNDFSLVLCGAA